MVVIDERVVHSMLDDASLRFALYSLHPGRPTLPLIRVRELLFADIRYGSSWQVRFGESRFSAEV